MKIINKIKAKQRVNILFETLFKGLFFLLFMFPILPNSFQSITIIIFTVLGLTLHHNNFKRRLNEFGVKPLLFTIAWVIFFAITLVYSSNIKEGLNQISKSISLLLIPVMFYFFTPKSFFKNIKTVGLLFVVSNCMFLLITYARVIYINSITCFPELQLMGLMEKIGFILKKNNTILFLCYSLEEKSILFIHKVYNSMSQVWSVVILCFFLMKKNKKPIKTMLIIALLFLIGFVLFQRSVVNVFLLLLLLLSMFFYSILKLDFRKKIIVIFFTVIGLTALVFKFELYKFNFIKKDVVPALTLIKSIADGKYNEGSDERWYLNITNIELIKKQPILGHGLGDVQDELNKLYHTKNNKVYKKAAEEELNSHNYYAYVTQVGGIVALGLFCFMLLYYMKLAYTSADWLLFLFLIILSVNLLFENVLYRIHGILFMVVFNSFFLMKNLTLNKNE